MKNDIIDKLNKILQAKKIDELEVVYIMVLIRKLIDHGKKEKIGDHKKQYFNNLMFYCNWVLHIELNKKQAKFILQGLKEKIKQSTIMAHEQNLNDKQKITTKEVFDFIQFEELKKEIKLFFEEQKIDLKYLINNELKWKKFILALGYILQDCPLVIYNDEKEEITKFLISSVDEEFVMCEIILNPNESLSIGY